jgi:Protein of unknown function (DUF3099)
MRKRTGSQVFRITGARQGLAEDVRGRQRRYVISMSVRTVAVILAATLWNVERYVAVVALVLGAVLPYIAVVMANAGRENGTPFPTTFIPAPVRPALLASHRDGSGEAAEPGPSSRAEPLKESAPEPAADPDPESAPGDAQHGGGDVRGDHR